MSELRASRRERAAATVLVFVTLTAIAAASVANGSFFDDETWTLWFLTSYSGPAAIVAAANAGDVHPPLSYLLLAALHRALGDWTAVKLATGTLTAAGMAALTWFAAAGLRRDAFFAATLLMASAASVVMWGASLRWYAFFNPLFWAAFGFVAWRARSLPTSAVAVSAAGTVLFHLNYLAVIAAPALALVACLRHGRAAGRSDCIKSSAAVAAGLIACIPQALVLVRVHLAYDGPQSGGLMMSLAQTGGTVLLGSAVFPLHPLALLFAAGAAVTIAWHLRRHGLAMLRRPEVTVLMVCGVAMVASGLGYRHRNSLYLYPLALVVLAQALAELPRLPRVGAGALAAAFQLLGMAHVVGHHGTVKRSFDTPYPLAVATIERLARPCSQALVVHHDAVLDHLLNTAGVPQDSSWRGIPRARNLPRGSCLIVVDGYAVGFPPDLLVRWRARVRSSALRRDAVERLGHDPYAGLKSRLSGEPVPEAMLVVFRYRVERNYVLLPIQ